MSLATPAEEEHALVFLVVVDETPELRVALRYACRRAKRTGGRIAMLYVMEPPEPQQWSGISDLMREEARQQAEATVTIWADQALALTGQRPILHIREGDTREELLKLLSDDRSISVLVLGASTGPEGPGPLISALTGKYATALRVPLAIVPGGLSEREIDAVT
jgi:nucleotide-binding universal stress UspA family protein